MRVCVNTFVTHSTARPDLIALIIYVIPTRIRYVNLCAPGMEGCRIILIIQ